MEGVHSQQTSPRSAGASALTILCSDFVCWTTSFHAASRFEASIVDSLLSVPYAAFTIGVGPVQPAPLNSGLGPLSTLVAPSTREQGPSFSGDGRSIVVVTLSGGALWPRTPAVGVLSAE